ncbi:hypothetical protein RHSIM_Rhsim05G0026300 [Rhododendron simsii]|uniref:F-box associated beta-propeller type 1 domain-containing protein n=1 Tax=Rhododendron simsii TaxID=118357 RepID=A0A834H077_RHOSS|nr:hypothetical protein RHSIM_Rhsim05G0026300 [Rhododendron simsii]
MDTWTTWTGTYDVQWRLDEKTTDASINGAVHWTARKTTLFDDDDGSQLIVSFHLADEVLREICLPKCHCARPNRNCGFISVIYEKPAFTIDRGDEELYDQQVWEIWLLEDYNNNRESWTKFRTKKVKVVNYTQSLVLLKQGIDASSTEMSSFAKELKEFVLGGQMRCCIVVVLVRDESNNFRRCNVIEHG